jgi:glutamine synthetase
LAILLAGLDGVDQRCDPVREGFGPFDGVLPEDAKGVHMMPRNLAEGLDALADDKKSLRRGDIFFG